MFKIEDGSSKNSGNPQRSKCIRFNTLNGYFYAKIARETPKGERAVQLSRQTRSPQRSKAPAPLDEAFFRPRTQRMQQAILWRCGRERLTSPRDTDTADRGGSVWSHIHPLSRPSQPLKNIFSGLFDTCCPQARGNLPRHSKPPVKFGERTWTEMTYPTAANAR
jgi:hypothetical protein